VDVWENNFCNWSAIANKCSWNTSDGDLGSVSLLKKLIIKIIMMMVC